MADLYEALSHADDAGLYYVSDARPGIRRVKRGKGFSYVGPDGEVVGPEERERIESIAIPPAWTDVWICPRPDGHILATGRDDKGRKQYRYHPRWREVRDDDKYDRLGEFGEALPGIREQIEEDLGRRGLPQRKVLATVVRLLDETLIRVGNDEYAEANESYGLTTLQDEHAEITGATVVLEFRGKSGIETEVALRDRRLARIVKQCQELPGEELFQYLDEQGDAVDVTSSHVNAYLRQLTDRTFSAKDFRTWGGTVLAAETLLELGPPSDEKAGKSNVLAAIDAAAARLGNTRDVCRRCYVHPAVTEAYVDGSLLEAWQSVRDRRNFRRSEAATLEIVRDR